jgi:hypothetical protein
MGLNADELNEWLPAIDVLKSALISADVEVVPDPDDPDGEDYLLVESLCRVIGIDSAPILAAWEDDYSIGDYDAADRPMVNDLGELFAVVPILLTSTHPAIVTYRQAITQIELARQVSEAIEGR